MSNPLRDQILNATPQKRRKRDSAFFVPEFGENGVTVEVREMNPSQRARFISGVDTKTSMPDMGILYAMIPWLVYDPETGARVFEDADLGELMEEYGSGGIERIALKAMELSGLGEEAGESGNDVAAAALAEPPSGSKRILSGASTS